MRRRHDGRNFQLDSHSRYFAKQIDIRARPEIVWLKILGLQRSVLFSRGPRRALRHTLEASDLTQLGNLRVENDVCPTVTKRSDELLLKPCL